MSIANFLKNNLKNIHPVIGEKINLIPYSKRPGMASIYSKRLNEIHKIDNYDKFQKQEFAFIRLKNLVEFSYNNIKFYNEFYNEKGFNPSQLITFDDIPQIPIINKNILQSVNIEDRSFPTKGRYIVNTGGSSGTPFSFYIEPSSMGHEWAHMHTIWNKLKYKQSDLKLSFGGRSDVKNLVDYDVVRNHFAIDIYADYDRVCEKLIKILKNYQIKYLHGYPTSIYDFAIYCKDNNPILTSLLRKSLLGAFLGSEYPHEKYRKVIEEVFGIQTISWYGHTERSILAYEKSQKYTYEPFLSYGYTEVLKNANDEFELIGTGYYNQASPLIRYNTGDIVDNPLIEDDILKSFTVKKGREGEFIVDKLGKRINLTGLIFGRHHELFNYSKFLQVKQDSPGKIVVFYVSEVTEDRASKMFDSSNLNLEIEFKKVANPIRTLAGKVGLLIK